MSPLIEPVEIRCEQNRARGTVHNSGRIAGCAVIRPCGGVLLRSVLSCEPGRCRWGLDRLDRRGGGHNRGGPGLDQRGAGSVPPSRPLIEPVEIRWSRTERAGTVHNSGRIAGCAVIRPCGGVLLRLVLSCERGGWMPWGSRQARPAGERRSTSGEADVGVSTGSTSGEARPAERSTSGAGSARGSRQARPAGRLDRRAGSTGGEARPAADGSTSGDGGSGRAAQASLGIFTTRASGSTVVFAAMILP